MKHIYSYIFLSAIAIFTSSSKLQANLHKEVKHIEVIPVVEITTEKILNSSKEELIKILKTKKPAEATQNITTKPGQQVNLDDSNPDSAYLLTENFNRSNQKKDNNITSQTNVPSNAATKKIIQKVDDKEKELEALFNL